MSRIGKKPIVIPQGVEVTVSDSVITVKGPKGELSRTHPPFISIQVVDGEAVVMPVDEKSKEARALWGTFASHIANMVIGVTEGYEKKMEVEGVGYRAEVQGNKLVLNVGYSHPVDMEIPQGMEASVEKNTISVKGIDKEKLGLFAAKVRSVRKPEPYKGKGIRYSDETVRRKEGKKTV